MSYILWIDDLRDPSGHHYARKVWSYAYRSKLPVVWVKTSQEAINYVQEHGLPVLMSLDHDLGILTDDQVIFLSSFDHDFGLEDEDKTPYFLKWLAYVYTGLTKDNFPIWLVHTDNCVGGPNMDSFLTSLKKSME